MSYTTAELIAILDRELAATRKGQRLVLSSHERIANPVLAKALGTRKLSQFFAYQDFRSEIHRYQREQGVSGLVWRTCRFGELEVRFPELHTQLIAIAEDRATLRAAKAEVMNFWRSATAKMTLWQEGEPPRVLTPQEVETMAQRAEWAEVEAGRTELYLSLCWGDPQACHCQWAYPESGCDRVVARWS